MKLKPWMTNAMLLLLGTGLVRLTVQLVREYTRFYMGYSGVSSWQLVLYVAAVVLLLVLPRNVDRWTVWIVLGIGLACRAAVLGPPPHLSTDVYRYVWDGIVQHAGVNPYRYVPGDDALAYLRAPHAAVYDHINRRDYARTIYPPVAQMLFWLITWLSPTVTWMKTVMVLFEGLTLWGLRRLLREMGASDAWVLTGTLVYAWCPMLVWEFAGSGHLDAMVMAFMVLALLFRYRRQPVWTGVFLALAVLTKFYPLVLLPALYQRGDWKMPATLAGLCALFYAPYLGAGKLVLGFLGGYVQEEGMATGARYFLLEWAQHLTGLQGLSSGAYLVVAAAVLGAVAVWAWQTSCREESERDEFLKPALGLALAMMLLFSPHYPWYVAWLVPLVVLVPGLTVFAYVGALFYLCTTAMAVGYGPEQYLLNEYLYGVVGIAFIIEMVARRWMPVPKLEVA